MYTTQQSDVVCEQLFLLLFLIGTTDMWCWAWSLGNSWVCCLVVDGAGTRAFATSCCDDELASRTNAFIQEHVQAVVERSQELLRIPSIIVDIVGKYCCPLLVVSIRGHLLSQVALLLQIGRAMLRVCLSLAWTVQYLEHRLLLVISALDFPLRTIKFCSVLFVIFVDTTGCDKQRFTDASPSVR